MDAIHTTSWAVKPSVVETLALNISEALARREKARTTQFDWPALSAALNTSNAGASGALKSLKSTKRGSSTSEGGVAKRKRGGGETS